MRTALTIPGAPPVVAWSLLGRFGFAMVTLSLLVYVQAETGSYAIAGAISAASLAGTAAGTVAQSRLIDRYGPTRPLLALALPHAALSAAVIAGVSAHLATLPLILLVAAQCASLPTVQVAPHRGGLAVLLAAATGFGLTIGFVVVSIIAGTASNDVPELAGLLLALSSTSSVVGGLVYQRRPWPRSLPARLPALLTVFGSVLLFPALFGGVAPLVAGAALAGATLVPQVTVHNTVLDRLVPRPRLSEAYGWITTVIAMANAGGQALGGLVIERQDYHAGFLAATACVLPLAAVVWAGRRRLAGSPHHPRGQPAPAVTAPPR